MVKLKKDNFKNSYEEFWNVYSQETGADKISLEMTRMKYCFKLLGSVTKGNRTVTHANKFAKIIHEQKRKKEYSRNCISTEKRCNEHG
jgi:hypothetical protein